MGMSRLTNGLRAKVAYRTHSARTKCTSPPALRLHPTKCLSFDLLVYFGRETAPLAKENVSVLSKLSLIGRG